MTIGGYNEKEITDNLDSKYPTKAAPQRLMKGLSLKIEFSFLFRMQNVLLIIC